MEDDCPATPLNVLPGRNSKSPNALSSPEPDGRKSPGGITSPETRCAICLGKLHNKAFTDICLHQFCFNCLVQWSKVKPECPLCKQPIKSIIYNVRSNLDYDQYNIERREPAYLVSEILHSYDFDLVPVDTRVRYRSTMTREYFGELGFLTGARTSYQVPNFVPTPTFHIQPSTSFSPASDRRISRSGSDFRRRIYEEDLWVRDLSDITGRYRECSPQFYRENPAQIHRIIPWLNREINSLMDDNESYTAYILDRILSFLPQYSIRSLEFRSVVEPYFGLRTDHFIHEFYTFCRSVYDISGFDQHASYSHNPNYATEVQEIGSTNEDSDIEVIGTLRRKSSTVTRSQTRRNPFRKSTRATATISNEPVAGPSGISTRTRSHTVEVVDDDNDDIEIIDYVKPQPEVVTLSSGDEFPSFSNVRSSRSTRKDRTKNEDSDDSVSGYSEFSCKRFRSSGRFRKHKNKSKCKTGEGDAKPKNKELVSNRKRSSSISSLSSCSSGTRASSSRKRKASKGYSGNTEDIHHRSDSYSSSYGGSSTSSSDYEPGSKSKRKKLSKGYSKNQKRGHSRRYKRKECKNHDIKKSKVKSCVVVPKSERKTETSTSYFRNDETATHRSDNPRTEKEAPSTASSYWSMMLDNDNVENSWRKGDNETE